MYEGIIASIANHHPIEKADRIVLADVMVAGVKIAETIVSKDSSGLGIYFGPDCQLSVEYCEKNDLVARYVDGVKVGGYLDPDKRRIKAQRFKGVKSEGLWMPIESLSGINLPDHGQEFNEGDKIGEPLSKRYPIDIRVQSNNKVTKTRININFPEHIDTDQLIHNVPEVARIPIGARVIITEKLHGTSHRVGNVEVPIELPWYKRFINMITRIAVKSNYFDASEWKVVHGSRRVVLDDNKPGYYGSNAFRYNAVGNPFLDRNEMVFGELVGFCDDKPIMNRQDTKVLKDVRTKFGDTMTYTYGQKEKECKFYVYRIAKYNGLVWQDLTWEQVKARARVLGYETVPELEIMEYDGNADHLVAIARNHAESNGSYTKSILDNHISEGVVVRFEHDGKTWVYKLKGFAFKVLEGLAQPETIEA